MKFLRPIKILVLGLTVISHVSGMKHDDSKCIEEKSALPDTEYGFLASLGKLFLDGIKPGPIGAPSDELPEDSSEYKEYVAWKTMVNQADAVLKLALQAKHVDEINKEVSQANGAVESVLRGLPVDDKNRLKVLWDENFYNPVRSCTGDIPARVAVMQVQSTRLSEQLTKTALRMAIKIVRS